MKRSVPLVSAIILAACGALLAALCTGVEEAAASLTNDTVIATYANEVIRYSDIKADYGLMLPHGASRELLSEFRARVESRNLRRILEEIILSNVVKKYAIKLDKDEIDMRKARLLRTQYGVDRFTEKEAGAQNDTISSLLRLARTWRENREAGERLYRSDFAKTLPREEWTTIKQMCGADEGLEKFGSLYPTMDAAAVNRAFSKSAKGQILKERVLAALKNHGDIPDAMDYLSWLRSQLALVVFHEKAFDFRGVDKTSSEKGVEDTRKNQELPAPAERQ